MRTWFALLAAPILALSDQSISYAAAGWTCAHQGTWVPHVLHGAFLVACVAAVTSWGVAAMLTTPGLWLQRITTKPPSDDQAAVAIRALEKAMELEKAQGGELVIA